MHEGETCRPGNNDRLEIESGSYYFARMQIDPNDLEEFKRLYMAEYGEELSQAEASEIAGNLVSLYELLCEPLPSEKAARQQAAKEDPPASPSLQ